MSSTESLKEESGYEKEALGAGGEQDLEGPEQTEVEEREEPSKAGFCPSFQFHTQLFPGTIAIRTYFFSYSFCKLLKLPFLNLHTSPLFFSLFLLTFSEEFLTFTHCKLVLFSLASIMLKISFVRTQSRHFIFCFKIAVGLQNTQDSGILSTL